MPTSFRQIIDKAVKEKRFLVVPGAHDALSARIIQKLGFETYFIGGFPAVGARYGVPDVGLKGFGEIAACVRDIMAACDLPVFVDGDDGYGDVKNVVHTVQSYERMGVSAILIEDQQWPKRCGHMVGKKVVPTEIAEAKIRAACSERINPETWILARTDARAVYDLDEAMRRAERYIRAGADGIFIEAPRSIEELKRIGKAFDVPQICNPLMGGHTPILSMEELGELGFNCAVLGLDTVMHAAKAIETVLLDMKSGKFARRNDGMDFEDYKKVVGYDKWESVDERFAPRDASLSASFRGAPQARTRNHIRACKLRHRRSGFRLCASRRPGMTRGVLFERDQIRAARASRPCPSTARSRHSQLFWFRIWCRPTAISKSVASRLASTGTTTV